MKLNVHILFTLMLLLLFSKAANSKAVNNNSVLLRYSQEQITVSKKLTAKNFEVKSDFCGEDLDQDIDDQFATPFLSYNYYFTQKNNLVTPSLKKVITHSAHGYHVRLFILFHSLIIP